MPRKIAQGYECPELTLEEFGALNRVQRIRLLACGIRQTDVKMLRELGFEPPAEFVAEGKITYDELMALKD